MSKPFRWDVSRREQLGSLALASPAPAYDEFFSDLRECAARVVAQVSRWNPPDRWTDPEMARAPLPRPAEALSRAAQVFELGTSSPERSRFSDSLARLPGVRQPWLRSLIHELRSTAA